MNGINIYLTLAITFLLATRLAGQSPHFLDQEFEKHCSGEINCMDQDGLGFIWIGSSDGLYRYDGYDYRAYPPVDSFKILNITALHFDDHDTLWVGTDAGEMYVIGRDHKLTRWKDDLHLPKMAITGIIRGKDDRLWFSTYGTGLFVQDKNSLDSFTTQDGLWDNEIYAMAIDTLGRPWVATDQGVSICMYEHNKRVDNLGTADGFVDEIVYHLISHKQHMWIGFQSGGLMGYDVVEDSLIIPREPWNWGETTGMILAQTEDLWLGTSEGLVKYNLSTHDIGLVRAENNRMQGISYLFHDSQDNMWCVTNKAALVCANMMVEITHAEIGDVQAVLADKSGHVWIGTSSGLLRYHRGSFLKISQYSDNVISLYEDAFGHIWIGTFGAGVIIWDPITDKSRRLSESHGLKNGSILSIDGDDERVWLATLGGIVEVQQHKNLLQQQIRFLQLDEINDLAISFFYTVFVDSHGDAWFGTDGKGVIKLESEVLISMQDKHAFPVKTVYTLCEDNQGNIWIGTATNGLYRWDGEVFSQYDVLDGNRNLPISILTVDINGHIVIGHSEGIDIFDPIHETTLPYRDEVGVNQLDPTMNALCKNHEGIWMGGLNKLVLLRPDIDGNQWPQLVIDDIKILGKSVSPDISGSFNSFENYTQFDVVGLWYGRTDALTYAYKLEGYDMEWHESSDRRISFGQLMPGDYTFKVAPVVADKKLEGHMGTYNFVINPPYWKKPWFVAISLLLLGVTLWSYQKFREARISAEANLAKERIESQYEVLKAQINPHFLFNSFNTLASIVEENTPQAIEYIEKLSDYYRSIIQLRNQKLIEINEELEMVNDYVFLLKKRFGAHLRVENHIEKTHGWIPPLSLQMLVENAIKHNIISQRKPLHISIQRTSDDYILVANNLQPKRTKPESTQFGLQNIQKRFEILSRKKVIIEHTNTKFTVRIPVINKDIP